MHSLSEDIPYKLSYRISSAYEQVAAADSAKQTVSKLVSDGGNGDKLRFLHYDDVDCFVFPQIDVVALGGLQLSVFHIECHKLQGILEHDAMARFVAQNEEKRALNRKVLGIEHQRYIEEKEQEELVLNALQESKSGDVDEEEQEEDTLYVNDDAESENEPLLPGVTAEAASGAEGKMSAFWGKMVASSSTKIESLRAGMDRIKIHIPRRYLVFAIS